MPKDYQAYLFDWDGTLARTLEIWLRVLKHELAARDINATDEDIAKGFGDWSHFTELGLAKTELPDFAEKVKTEAIAELPHVPLYDGVQDMFARLRQAGKRTALITTSPRETVDAAQAHGELVAQFDCLVTGDRITAHKPDPEGIELALQELGIEKDKAVMLGDSDKDLGAAKNAGIDSILFYPASHEIFYDRLQLEVAYRPVKVITDWSELVS